MKDDNKNSSECQTVASFAVYVIWCQPTNKFYVGVTGQKPQRRIRQHRRGKQFIDREIQRIGWDGNWDWWVVEENVPSNLITEREQYWVKFFGSVYPNGYNKTCGGIGNTIVSEDTRKKISTAHLGKERAPFTEEHKANISKARTGKKSGQPAWNRGIPCTEEAKSKIREKLTGRKRPDQSERMKGENNPNFGKPLAEGTRAKLREKALERDMSGENNPHYGKHHTDEVKAAQSARMRGENNPNYGKSPANKGVPWTEEQKAAQSARMQGEKNGFYGKKHTEATKAILREKALARAAAKRAAKAVAEENLAAANSTPTNLSTLLDAVIF